MYANGYNIWVQNLQLVPVLFEAGSAVFPFTFTFTLD